MSKAFWGIMGPGEIYCCYPELTSFSSYGLVPVKEYERCLSFQLPARRLSSAKVGLLCKREWLSSAGILHRKSVKEI